MASGVKVHENVKKIFEEMKVVKNEADENKRVRLVTFNIDGDIVVKDVVRQEDLKDVCDVSKFVQSKMPDKSCCYVLYDCHYETCESKKKDLVFITWTSQNATIKEKMLYSSSRCALLNVFRGVKHCFEAHDMCDTDGHEIASKLGKEVTKLEGKDLCHH